VTDIVVGALLVGVSSNDGISVTDGNGGFVGARVGRSDSTSSFVGV